MRLSALATRCGHSQLLKEAQADSHEGLRPMNNSFFVSSFNHIRFKGPRQREPLNIWSRLQSCSVGGRRPVVPVLLGAEVAPERELRPQHLK